MDIVHSLDDGTVDLKLCMKQPLPLTVIVGQAHGLIFLIKVYVKVYKNLHLYRNIYAE